jgi:hypothetical protein
MSSIWDSHLTPQGVRSASIMPLNLKNSISKNLPYVVTFNQLQLLFAKYAIVFCNVDKWYQK